MFSFWHRDAVYTVMPVWTGSDVALRRTSYGMPSFAVEAMAAAGLKVAGKPGDDNSELMAATDPAKPF